MSDAWWTKKKERLLIHVKVEMQAGVDCRLYSTRPIQQKGTPIRFSFLATGKIDNISLVLEMHTELLHGLECKTVVCANLARLARPLSLCTLFVLSRSFL